MMSSSHIRSKPISFTDFLYKYGITHHPVSLKTDSTVGYRSTIINWGLFIVGLYTAFWIAPSDLLDILRMLMVINALCWCIVANKILKYKWPVCFPVVMAFVIQLWSVFTAIHASYYLSRPLGIGRADLYWMEHITIYFVVAGLIKIEPKTRDTIIIIPFLAFILSSFVGWLQFFRVGPAVALAKLYTFKDIDFWDGKSGLRACGLSVHPAILGAQAFFCLSVVASRSFVSQPRKIDIFWMFFFSATVIFTQARAVLVALFVAWVYFLFMLVKQNYKLGIMVLISGGILLMFAVLFASNRLGYALQSSSLKNDDSYLFRSERIWIQLEPISKALPMTGIGPSSGLLLGTGPEDKWVTIGKVMESMYKLFLAMYGFPGLVLIIIMLGGTALSCMRVLLSRLYTDDVKRVAALGIAYVIFLAINGYTANTVDGYVIVPIAFLIAGLATGGSKTQLPSSLE